MKRGFIYGVLFASIVWTAVLTLPIVMPKPVSRALFSFLDVSSSPARSDYILIPSGNLFHRLPVAIDLLYQHLGDTLILTVTEPPAWRRESRAKAGETTERSMVERLLRTNGIGDTQVVFLGESRSTWQDAKLFTHFLTARPAATALAISDGYHLRRLRLSMNRTDPAAAARVAYAASSSFDDLLRRDTEYSDAYQQVFKEWFKLVFYSLGRA